MITGLSRTWNKCPVQMKQVSCTNNVLFHTSKMCQYLYLWRRKILARVAVFQLLLSGSKLSEAQFWDCSVNTFIINNKHSNFQSSLRPLRIETTLTFSLNPAHSEYRCSCTLSSLDDYLVFLRKQSLFFSRKQNNLCVILR